MKPTRRPISHKVARADVARDFNFAGSTCPLWVIQADELWRAFTILADTAKADLQGTRLQPDVFRLPYMLGGLAIENLLKALLISRGHPSVKNGRFLLDTHDLLRLAEKASVSLDTAEAELLERLCEFVTWGGRYPIPLLLDDMRPREMSDGSHHRLTDGFVLTDYHAIEQFLKRLRAEFPSVTYELEAAPAALSKLSAPEPAKPAAATAQTPDSTRSPG